jgi:hypothetical protein
MNFNQNKLGLTIILSALISTLMMLAIIIIVVANNTQRIAASDKASLQRTELQKQNDRIEGQNNYKICILEGLYRTLPEQRTEAYIDNCKSKTLGDK